MSLHAPSFTLFVLLAASLAHSGPKADERAIRGIPDAIVEAWNRGDGKALASVYAPDGILVAGDGTVTRGVERIAAYHDAQFADFLKGTTLAVEVVDVRLLGPDIALMQTTGGIMWKGQTAFAPGNKGIQTFVVVREDAEWRVKHFQNTRIRAD
jgi:uncharacterized protein (TIGR02246 family)